MKQIICILTFLILVSCGQSKSEQIISTFSDTPAINNNAKSNIRLKGSDNSEDDYRQQSLTGFEKATLFNLTDTITADCNGDGIADEVFLKRENESSGIIIKHGQTNEIFRINFGGNFGTWATFDCNWVDYLGLVKDKETSETVFGNDGDVAGSQKVKLQNLSIVIGANQVGDGLITFGNGKYKWIHQTC